MMKPFRTLAVASLVLALATPALAGPEHGSHERGPRGMGSFDGDPSDAIVHMTLRAVHQLDLSEEQKTAIHDILKDTKKDLKALGDAGADNRKALHEALTSDTIDEEALATAAQSAGDLVAERIVIAAHAARAVRAELSAEQLAQLETMREEHMAKLQEKRKRRDES